MLRRIGNILSTTVLILLLVTATMLLLPPLFGVQSFAVLSGSMAPEIQVGELVYVKEVSPEQWKVGDVITYTLLGSTRVTHRIVEIDEVKRQVITKGDANDSVDGTPVPFDNIVGCVAYHVPLLGYISIYGKTPTGIVILCGMVMLSVIFNFLPDRKMHLYDQNVTGL